MAYLGQNLAPMTNRLTTQSNQFIDHPVLRRVLILPGDDADGAIKLITSPVIAGSLKKRVSARRLPGQGPWHCCVWVLGELKTCNAKDRS